MVKQGQFITFEGGEGAGKSTQIKMLVEHLKEKMILTHLTREPGGCDMAEKIRDLLVKGSVNTLDELSELLLFSAARHEHVRQKIRPLLDKNYCVISDRFYLSTYVYQSFAGGLDFDFVEMVTKKAIEGAEPNLTILLDIDPKVGLVRSMDNEITHDEKRFEGKDIEFHEKVRQGFLDAAKTSENIIVIDGSQDLEKVHQDIINELEKRDII